MNKCLLLGGLALLLSPLSFAQVLGTGTGPAQNYNVWIGHWAGNASTIGSSNVGVGVQAGYTNTGNNNTFVGYRAGYYNGSGQSNVFMGYQSGLNNTGNYNTFVGYSSGVGNRSGSYNTLLGDYAGFFNNGANYNTFVGHHAGYFVNLRNDGSSMNTMLGSEAGYSWTEGIENTVVGHKAGYDVGIGDYNTLVGTEAGNVDQNYFNQNTMVGYQAGKGSTDASSNTYVGYQTGQIDGQWNVALGMQAGVLNEADNSVSVGYRAGYAPNGTSMYQNNVYVGAEAGADVTTNTKMIGIGRQALRFSNSTNTIAIGEQAGESMSGSYNVYLGHQVGKDATGSYNVLLGGEAGEPNATGNHNTLVGYNAGTAKGDYNTVMGSEAGRTLGTGSGNVAMGYSVANGTANTNPNYNVVLGTQAGVALAGDENVMLGYRAGKNNTGARNILIGAMAGDSTTGDHNLIVGYQAGRTVAGGTQNVILGDYTAQTTTAGYVPDRNVVMGYQAGYQLQGDGNVLIGYQAGYNVLGSDKLVIANSKDGNALLWGNFANGELAVNSNATNGYTLYVNGNAYATGLWLPLPSAPEEGGGVIENPTERLMAVSGYTYSFGASANPTETGGRNLPAGPQYGLLAQEVQAVLPELVQQDEEGYYAVNYIGLIPVLVEGFRELKAENSALQNQINQLHTALGTSPADLPGLVEELAEVAYLDQNTPNPFGGLTEIHYYLPPTVSEGSLLIFDLKGTLIKSYPTLATGDQTLQVTGDALPSGMYFYTLIADGYEVDTKRMIIQE